MQRHHDGGYTLEKQILVSMLFFFFFLILNYDMFSMKIISTVSLTHSYVLKDQN